jgi:NAD(P)-dependent dehydrogenase (short-subunit alcohol dehydrogenase family)
MSQDSTAGAAGLPGRTAVITGGGSGIGRAVAIALARRGMDVLVIGRRAEAVRDTAQLAPGIRHLTADVTDPQDGQRIIQAAVAFSGRLDLLVNNAGVLGAVPLGHIEPAMARRVWETNVLGPVLVTQAALPYLAACQGAIINVSSTFGSRPAPGASQYGASKAALDQLTRSWALELARQRIRVNSIAPGPTESEALDRLGLPSTQIAEIKAGERSRIPLGRLGKPEDVAYWVAALADPAAAWVTGQVIGIDGGYSLTR